MKFQSGSTEPCSCPKRWIKMAETAKRMPCDPELVSFTIDPKGKDRFVVPGEEGGRIVNGTRLTGTEEAQISVFEPATEIGLGYVPHWATCPDRDRFKKDKRK